LNEDCSDTDSDKSDLEEIDDENDLEEIDDENKQSEDEDENYYNFRRRGNKM